MRVFSVPFYQPSVYLCSCNWNTINYLMMMMVMMNDILHHHE